MNDAESAFKSATEIARIGKANYQYARFLLSQNRVDEAVRAFERARQVEPNNLQNLLALAEAYVAARRHAEAITVYRRIAELHDLPFGRIRAVPELVEYEFGEAHRALAMEALANKDERSGEQHLRKAVEILGEYWSRRKNPIVQLHVRPEKALLAGGQYEESLAQLAELLRKSGRQEEAAEIDARRSQLQSDMEQDRSANAVG
jgi:tetratricopeptide (TPR) repeat protein